MLHCLIDSGIAIMPPKSINYKEEEDVRIAKGFIKGSMDPTVGTDQSGDRMWTIIQKEFTDLGDENSDSISELIERKVDRYCAKRHQ